MDNSIDVSIVCNAAWFCDSQMDVLTDTSYSESILKRGTTIPHILDHNHSAIAHIGDVSNVYTSEIALVDLGLEAEGTTTALIMDSTVKESYNKAAYNFYKEGKISQHSIGLRYEAIDLAINSTDEEDAGEKAIWDKYYPQVINKELVDKKGYFFVVSKADILENSAVLFGSNSLTPTLSVSVDNTKTDSFINNSHTLGENMTKEEDLQGKIASLTVELASAKTELASAKAAASLEERTRVSSIIKAANTFGIAIAAAEKFIEKGSDMEAVTIAFETIKEAAQSATHVDTSATMLPAVDKPAEPKAASFEESLLAGLKASSEQPKLFGGIK
jgi:hypothetical protein